MSMKTVVSVCCTFRTIVFLVVLAFGQLCAQTPLDIALLLMSVQINRQLNQRPLDRFISNVMRYAQENNMSMPVLHNFCDTITGTKKITDLALFYDGLREFSGVVAQMYQVPRQECSSIFEQEVKQAIHSFDKQTQSLEHVVYQAITTAFERTLSQLFLGTRLPSNSSFIAGDNALMVDKLGLIYGASVGINSDATNTGATTIGNSTGALTMFGKDVSISAPLSNSGLDITTSATITGSLRTKTLGVTGDTALAGMLDVTGTATVYGNLNAHGKVTFNTGPGSYHFPTGRGAINQVLKLMDTAGTVTWAGAGSGSGDVVGPATSIDTTIARFNGTNDKTIQGSGIAIANTDFNITVTGNGQVLINARTSSGATTIGNILNGSDVTLLTKTASSVKINDTGTGAVIIGNVTGNTGIASSLDVTGTTTVYGNFNAHGKVTFNTGPNSFKFPVTRGTVNQILALADNNGNMGWLNNGDVVGPASAIANAIANFDGATGKAIKDSGIVISSTDLDITVTSAGKVKINANNADSGSIAIGNTVAGGAVTVGSASVLGIRGTGVTVSSGSTLDVDAVGQLQINSSGSTIDIGNDAVAQAITIGTGAAARTITIGSTVGASATTIQAGSGNTNIASSLDITGTATVYGNLNAHGTVICNTGPNSFKFPVTRGMTNQVLAFADNSGNMYWTYAVGDVTGPASAIANAIANFDLATGKAIKDSGIVISNIDLDITVTDNGKVKINANNADSGAIAIGNTVAGGAVTVGSASVLGIRGTGVSVSSGSTLDVDAVGQLQINSSGSTIDIGNDAVAQAITIGTGAAARTITMGSTVGASATTIQAGSGNTNIASSLDITGTATVYGNFNAHGTVIFNTGPNAFKFPVTRGMANQVPTLADNNGNMGWLNNGDVVGPASATANAIANFDGVTGKAIKDSGIVISNTDLDITVTSAGKVKISSNNTDSGAIAIGNTVAGGAVTVGSASAIGIRGAGVSVSSVSALDVDAVGQLQINSSGSTIDIGNDAVAQTITIGTGAAARALTIGSTVGASATTIQAGSGNTNITSSLDVTGTATVYGNFNAHGTVIFNTGPNAFKFPVTRGVANQALALADNNGNISWRNDGDVVGPADATANAIANFNGTTGKIIKDSGIVISNTDLDITVTSAGKIKISANNTDSGAIAIGNTVAGGTVFIGSLSTVTLSGSSTLINSAVDVVGDICVTGRVNCNQTSCPSDRAIKTDINTLDQKNCFDAINKLRPVSYVHTPEFILKSHATDDKQIGLIAQEVETIIPEVVHHAKLAGYGDVRAISYERLVPFLIGSIQELTKRIEFLEHTTRNGISGCGDVVGPASATANAIANFDDTTGKVIKDSGIVISSTDLDITVTSAGKIKISANNTDSGSIAIGNTVAGGAVTVGSANALGISGVGVTVSSGSTLDVDAVGQLQINSSGSTIDIGNDAVAQAITIGTGAAVRAITIGNNTSMTALTLTAGSGNTNITSSLDITGTTTVYGNLNAHGTVIFNTGPNSFKLPVTRGMTNQVLALADNNGNMRWNAAGGDVNGPTGAIANAITNFNGTTGKIIKDSGIVVSATDLDITVTSAGKVKISANNTDSGAIAIGNTVAGGAVTVGSASAIGIRGTGVTVASGSMLDVDAVGQLQINSSGSTIDIGNDAVAQAITIGTGAAARAITIGSTVGASATTIQAGSGNTNITASLDITGTTTVYGNFNAHGTVIFNTGPNSFKFPVTRGAANQALALADNNGNMNWRNNGDVTGPTGATANAIANFDLATGKAIKDSGIVISNIDLDITVTDNGKIKINANNTDSGAIAIGNTVAGGAVTVGSANALGISGVGVTVSSGSTLDVDAVGQLQINSSGSTIDIGNDAVAQAITIGTGAAARTITMGSTVGASATTIQAGSGNTNIASSLDITGTATVYGNFNAHGTVIFNTGPNSFKFPVTHGTTNQVLALEDNSGNMHWHTGAGGDVTGPTGATANTIANFDGITGEIIKDSGIVISSTDLDITVTSAGKIKISASNADSGAIAIGNTVAGGIVSVSSASAITLSAVSTLVNSDLDVVGNICTMGSVNCNQTSCPSDRTIKTDINSLDQKNCFDAVNKLRPVSYVHTPEFILKAHATDDKQIGLIAQEVETIIPEVVHHAKLAGYGDVRTISYERLVPFLIGSIQELTKRIELLEHPCSKHNG